jgi:hypothetical protein
MQGTAAKSSQLEVAGEGVLVPAIPATSNWQFSFPQIRRKRGSLKTPKGGSTP